MASLPDPALLAAAIEEVRALCGASAFVRDVASGAALLGPDGPPGPLHPDDAPAYAAAVAGAGPYRVGYRVGDGAGGWREVEEGGRVVEVGGRAYRVGAALDVTERVEAARARSRYEAIIEAQTEWIVRQAPDGRNTFVNEAFCRFKGMTREELIAPVHEHLQRVEAESRDLFERNRASLTPERPQATTEIRVRYGDGVVGWQLWTDIAIFDEAGRVVEYQCVGRDTTEQHNARAALEASEARYRGVVEAQNDLITRVRPDGRATFVNDAYCRYMGMTREQLLDPGWDDLSMLSAEARAAVEAEWAALTPERPDHTHECEVTLPDGRRRVEQWRQRGIFDEAGRLIEVQGVGRDITEQRDAERALRESEARLRAIIETQTEWVTRQTRESRYTFVNSAYCRYMGMTEAELTAPDYDDYAAVEPADRERFFAARAAATPERPTFTMELRTRHPDGSARVEEWTETALFGEDGRLQGFQAVGRDMTAQRRAEAALRESETRLAAFMEHAPVGMYLKDLDGRYLMLNPEMGRVFGRPAAEMLGRGPGEVLTPDEVAEVRRFDDEVLETGQPTRHEECLDGRDAYAWSMVIRFPVKDASGRIVQIGGFDVDITAQKRALAELAASEQRFRRFAEAHPVPLCALRTADWRIIFVNPAYLDLFQLTREELEVIDKRRQWGDPEKRAPYYERLLREGRVDGCEVELRRKDGTVFPALMSSRRHGVRRRPGGREQRRRPRAAAGGRGRDPAPAGRPAPVGEAGSARLAAGRRRARAQQPALGRGRLRLAHAQRGAQPADARAGRAHPRRGRALRPDRQELPRHGAAEASALRPGRPRGHGRGCAGARRLRACARAACG